MTIEAHGSRKGVLELGALGGGEEVFTVVNRYDTTFEF
jgi:hypothetical protein